MIYRASTAIVLCVAIMALSGCGSRETQVDDQETSVVDTGVVCSDPMSNPQVLKSRRDADLALRKSMKNGAADAATLASKAVGAGDYRLAASIGAGGVSTRDFGAECRAGYALDQRMTRVIAYHDADDKLEGFAPGGKIGQFGKAYNEAVLDDPRYPYRDICRSVRDTSTSSEQPSQLGQSGQNARPDEPRYGFGYLARTSGPLTADQAARRGSLPALRQIFDRDKSALNKPDLFGLTPLSWAIAYRQAAAADWLLAAGASPGGAGCHTILDHSSPMQVARAIHWRAMVTHMRPLVSPEDFNDLREAPRVSDKDIAAFNHQLTALNEKYRSVFNKDYLTRHHLIVSLDANGKALSCRFDPATVSPGYDADICAMGLAVLHWQPARSAYGTDIPEDASLLVGVRGD